MAAEAEAEAKVEGEGGSGSGSETVGRGGCLCGAVRYRLDAAPLYSLVCYCRDCQRISGGGGAGTVVMQPSQFVVEEGQEALRDFVKVGDLGSEVCRRFCEQCGTQVYSWTNKHKDQFMGVQSGTLDDAALFKPTAAIFWSRKLGHHAVPEHIACFDTYPPPPPGADQTSAEEGDGGDGAAAHSDS